jgi:hypothetical protein
MFCASARLVYLVLSRNYCFDLSKSIGYFLSVLVAFECKYFELCCSLLETRREVRADWTTTTGFLWPVDDSIWRIVNQVQKQFEL